MTVCDRCGAPSRFVVGLDQTERSNPPRTKFLASYDLCPDCAAFVVTLVRGEMTWRTEPTEEEA